MEYKHMQKRKYINITLFSLILLSNDINTTINSSVKTFKLQHKLQK